MVGQGCRRIFSLGSRVSDYESHSSVKLALAWTAWSKWGLVPATAIGDSEFAHF